MTTNYLFSKSFQGSNEKLPNTENVQNEHINHIKKNGISKSLILDITYQIRKMGLLSLSATRLFPNESLSTWISTLATLMM